MPTLGVVDLSQIEHLALDAPAAGYPATLHYAPMAVLFAVLLPIGTTQEHGT